MIDGIIYVVSESSLEAYNPKTNTWSTKAPLPTPRRGLAVQAVDGILYAIGGASTSGRFPSVDAVEAYDPKTNTWTAKAPMPTARCCMAAGVINGLIYVAGGFVHQGASIFFPVAKLEVYDPKTDTWSTKTPMSMPHYWNGAAGVLEGKLYVAGGNNWVFDGPIRQTIETALVEAYDPTTDSWSAQPPMPTPRALLGAAVVDDTLYAIGGIRNFTLVLDVNEAFSPFLPILIDIKPGEASNTINLRSRGVITVAVLSTAEFGATTVDPATVKLAGAGVTSTGRGTPLTTFRDVDRDGRLDLLLHFRTQDLQLTPTATEAVLKGRTFSGQLIRGTDAVRILP